MLQTARGRMLATLKEIKHELRRRLHDSVPEVGQWLRSVVLGHMHYFGVPMNGPALTHFRFRVVGYWWRSLR